MPGGMVDFCVNLPIFGWVWKVHATPVAGMALGRLSDSPMAAIEAFHKMQVLRTYGLAGERLIAVVNDRYDVHLVECSRPGPSILTISDPQAAKEMWVVDFPAVRPLTRARVIHLATQAAYALRLVLIDVHPVE